MGGNGIGIRRAVIRSEGLNAAIEGFEGDTPSTYTVERGTVYNADGSVHIPERFGTNVEVEYSPEEYESMEGKTLIHTHVDTGDLTDRLFSANDIYTASTYKMNEIIANTSNSRVSFIPNQRLKGNTSLRDQLFTEYDSIFETGKSRVREAGSDEAKIQSVINDTARAMSNFMFTNQRKYGYTYIERGVF